MGIRRKVRSRREHIVQRAGSCVEKVIGAQSKNHVDGFDDAHDADDTDDADMLMMLMMLI